MTLAAERHDEYGAVFGTRNGVTVVESYGRPARAATAVRNGVGAIEMGYGIVIVEGEDRYAFVDDAVSNRIPSEDGQGCYALLLNPQGRIRTDMYVYTTKDRLLVITPPGQAEPLSTDWSEKVFIQDVDITIATDKFGIFGVHGPQSTEKMESILSGATVPTESLSFVRGSINDIGVTVVSTDNPIGETGYEVICDASDAPEVCRTLFARGVNSTPMGYDTWDVLTLEAGTPVFESELDDRVPNVLGVRNALDFEKGCYVGQEIVSKIQNRGRPSRRLIGLEPADTPDVGAAIFDGDIAVGEITRATAWSTVDRPLALGLVDWDSSGDVAVRVDGETVPADRVSLPFVEGSARSARLPTYPSD